MVGGVLADRYERKGDSAGARYLRCGFGLCVRRAALPNHHCWRYLLGLWDWLFASLGVTALLAATPALVGERKSDAKAGAITMLTVRLGSLFPRCWGMCLPAAAWHGTWAG